MQFITAKDMTLIRTLITIALFLSSTLALGQDAAQHPDWPGRGQLFVGTRYQPVDRSPEQIRQDIALMKQAGFRMGDLSWDAFGPSEGDALPVVSRDYCGGVWDTVCDIGMEDDLDIFSAPVLGRLLYKTCNQLWARDEVTRGTSAGMIESSNCYENASRLRIQDARNNCVVLNKLPVGISWSP